MFILCTAVMDSPISFVRKIKYCLYNFYENFVMSFTMGVLSSASTPAYNSHVGQSEPPLAAIIANGQRLLDALQACLENAKQGDLQAIAQLRALVMPAPVPAITPAPPSLATTEAFTPPDDKSMLCLVSGLSNPSIAIQSSTLAMLSSSLPAMPVPRIIETKLESTIPPVALTSSSPTAETLPIAYAVPVDAQVQSHFEMRVKIDLVDAPEFSNRSELIAHFSDQLRQPEYFAACLKLAHEGSVKAKYLAAISYKYGYGGPRSDDDAYKLFNEVAQTGFSYAQCDVGDCFANGHGVSQNDKTALEWYQKASKQGLTEANVPIACFQGLGRGGLTTDEDKAVDMIMDCFTAGVSALTDGKRATTPPLDVVPVKVEVDAAPPSEGHTSNKAQRKRNKRQRQAANKKKAGTSDVADQKDQVEKAEKAATVDDIPTTPLTTLKEAKIAARKLKSNAEHAKFTPPADAAPTPHKADSTSTEYETSEEVETAEVRSLISTNNPFAALSEKKACAVLNEAQATSREVNILRSNHKPAAAAHRREVAAPPAASPPRFHKPRVAQSHSRSRANTFAAASTTGPLGLSASTRAVPGVVATPPTRPATPAALAGKMGITARATSSPTVVTVAVTLPGLTSLSALLPPDRAVSARNGGVQSGAATTAADTSSASANSFFSVDPFGFGSSTSNL